MSYLLENNKARNLVTVTYQADTSFRDRLALLDELVGLLKDNPSLDVVVDITRAVTTMTESEQLQYGELLAMNSRYFRRNKTAIVARKNSNPHPIILAEAYVEGFENFCEFDNKIEAELWINGEIK